MNNKGFTLIELIATIALLAIIAIISFVSINGALSDSNVSNCKSLVSSIKSAVKEYVSDNRYGTIDKDILASDLVNWKYLSGPVVDPFDNTKEITNNIYINIILNDSDNTVDDIIIWNVLGKKVDCDSGKW